MPYQPPWGGWGTRLTKQHLSMSQIKEFIKQNEGRFLEDLFALIRIPSVSAQSEHKPDMQRCAEHWREHLLSLGVQTVEIYQTAGNPIVFGHYEKDPSKPTILVYGHYDVMPPSHLSCGRANPSSPRYVTAISGRVVPMTTRDSP